MNISPIHVALVEDNADLRDDLRFQLGAQGIVISALGNSVELDGHLGTSPCDILILDIGLPGEDGLSIAARLRQVYPTIGIIMLTAMGGLDTRLDGFARGADSYLVKPVSWQELLAQIHALYRRVGTPQSTQADAEWVLRHAGRELKTPTGQSIKLTHMEGQVLKLLAQHAGHTVDRDTLIAAIAGGQAHQFDPRRLEVCISRLRQKMLDVLDQPPIAHGRQTLLPIQTVRSIGYAFSQAITISHV